MTASPGPDVVLVGRRLLHNENLGLCYLRAALRAAGHSVEIHYVNNGSEVGQAVTAIRKRPPRVLGLSLADGGSALWPLSVGELARRHGYRGHITSGGQFATLSRHWLLSRYPWLDSVVRFAGETALVALHQRVEAKIPVDGLGGVTTRAGDGPPADVLDDQPMRLLPERDELPRLLGRPAAHIAATRGCAGRCHYCGPAALQTLEKREGRRAGVGSLALMQAGVGGVRRRDVNAVADEMAALYHERGVRYFYFVDEHLLPYDEPAALSFLSAWGDALKHRRVGPLGIGAMLRADRIGPELIRAFARVGLVRTFVGFEIATAEVGRVYGRPAPGPRELALLDCFAREGVATVSNLLLVHPESTPGTIAAGIDLLASIPEGVFEATRMMVYHGTLLHERLERQSRLFGNPFRYGYTFADERAARFSEIFSRLRGEAFWDYSVAYRTHDAFLAVALAKRLEPGRVPSAVVSRLADTRRRVNALYVEAYRRALDVAVAGGGFHEADPLVEEMAERADALHARLEEIERSLLLDRERPFAPMRAAAAGVLTFALLGPAAACGRSHSPEDGGRDARIDARADSGRDAFVETDAGPCTPEEQARARDEVAGILSDIVPCFSGSVAFPDDGSGLSAYADPTGYLPTGASMVACRDLPDIRGRLEADAVAAVAGREPMCIEGQVVSVMGGVSDDLTRMGETAASMCPEIFDFARDIRIVLAPDGTVTEVRAAPGSEALAACVERVLAGMTFPCLAGFEVCPEFVIAE